MSKKSTINPYLLSLVVLINGMIIMIFEIVGARMMSPYFGGSIIVWTSLIGVIMLSLSIGYWLGGWWADKIANRQQLSVILLLAAVFTLVSVYLYAPVFAWFQQQRLGLIVGSLLASSIIFLLPSMFMGMVLPYVTKLATKKISTLGVSVGRLYALATIGSILGTFLAGFVLIPSFNISDVVLVQAILLIILSTVTWYANRLQLLFVISILFYVLVGPHSIYPVFANSIYQTNSAYNYIYVVETKTNDLHQRYLMANDNIESNICLNCEQQLNNVYAEYRRLFTFQPDIREVLIIGGGGYTMANDILDKYGANVTVVEIDPVMTDVSRRYFGLNDSPRLTIHHQDGRQFLQQTDRQYDLIIIDAFLDSSSIPAHLTTREFFQSVGNHLTDNGLLFINTVSAVEGSDSLFFQTEYNTLNSVFPQLLIYSYGQGEMIANILFIASRQPDFPMKKLETFFQSEFIRQPRLTNDDIFTDQWAPVAYYNANF